MPKTLELPIRTATARQQLGWGETYTSVVLHKLGQSGARFVFLSELVACVREHRPKVTDRYPKGARTAPRVTCPACGRDVAVVHGALHHHKNKWGVKCGGLNAELCNLTVENQKP